MQSREPTVEVVQVTSVSPIVTEEGPTGVLVIDSEGNFLVLEGRSALALMSNGTPRRARPRSGSKRGSPPKRGKRRLNKRPPGRCLACGQTFTTIYSARSHVASQHPDRSVERTAERI